MINCIIIDDEPKARVLLKAVVEQYCPELSVAALCEDLPSGIKAIKKYKPTIVFLDIEMPGHSGLEILDFFEPEEVRFNIIFTTAYNEYALQAFKFAAIDYLLKPIQHQQLQEAVQRFLLKESLQEAEQLKILQQHLNTTTSWEDRRIVVPSGQSLRFLKSKEIIFIKGEAAYSELHLNDGTKLLASRNLKHFEDLLAEIPCFFRCHKSYIVNTNYIHQYVKSEGGYLVLQNGQTISISTDKTDELLAKLT